MQCKHAYHKSASILPDVWCKISYMKRIGQILEEARKKKKLSQSEAARLASKLTGYGFTRNALHQTAPGRFFIAFAGKQA